MGKIVYKFKRYEDIEDRLRERNRGKNSFKRRQKNKNRERESRFDEWERQGRENNYEQNP